METLHTIRKWLDKIVGTICIFLFALMVVVGSYQIITRFIFNNPSTISEELLTYSFAWMAMFATAYVFGKRDHMRMTFVVDKLAPAQRKVLEIVLEVLVIAFAAIVLIYGGFNIMGLTMTQKTASLGVMMGQVYAVVPLSGILIAIYGILNVVDLCKGTKEKKRRRNNYEHCTCIRTDYFSPLDYHADCRCADRSSTWCIFRMCNSSNHGFECSRTDRMPENLLRYLCIQPACYPVLYSCRKYYE